MLFKNCTFSFDFGSHVAYKDKALLRKQIIDHGGTLSYIVTKKVYLQ